MGMSKTSLARVISTCTWGLPDQVRSILNKYGATMLMPGVSGVLRFGYQPGNYRESTGQTLAAADQQVGLVVDAAGSLGPELVTNGDFSNGSAGWSSASTAPASWVVTGGKLVMTADGVNRARTRQTISTIAGRTYQVTAQLTNAEVGLGTSAGGIQYVDGPQTTGVFRHTFTATTASLFLQISSVFNGTSFADNISVRELTGIHASQSTSGFQPVLRRGLVNLLTYSTFQNGLTDASIRGGNLSLSSIDGYGNAIAFGYDGATLTYAYKGTFSAVNGTVYTMAAVVKMDDGLAPTFGSATPHTSSNPFAFVIGGVAPEPTGFSITPLGNSLYMVVGVSGGTVTLPTSNGVIKYTQNDSRTFKVTNYAIFQGTVTAEEIIAAGGIPVTTSAPASSANGIQSWQFDGTDDRLSLSAVPFQMADDHFVVAGVACGSTAASLTVFEVGAGGTPRCASIRITNGVANVLWHDGSSFANTNNGAVTLGERYVHSARMVGTNYESRKNTTKAVLIRSLVPSTMTSAVIGARTTNGEVMNGHIHGVIFGKGAISDSELLTLERFMASLQGRTL